MKKVRHPGHDLKIIWKHPEDNLETSWRLLAQWAHLNEWTVSDRRRSVR